MSKRGSTNVDLNLALALHKDGKIEDAERFYREFLTHYPGNYEAQLLLGILLGQKGCNHEALGLLDAALAIDPRSALALLNKGNVLVAMGKPDHALQTYNAALALYPKQADVLAARGIALARLSRFGEALASLDDSLAVNPAFPEALFHRGNVLQSLNRYLEAAESYSRAIAIRPDQAYLYNHRANALRRAGKLAEALADTEYALKLDPKNPESFNDRGNALLELNRIEDAIQSYSRALAIKPDFIEALNNRGIAFRDLRQFENALRDFDRILEISPTNARALWSKSIVKLILGDLTEGLELYEWRKKMPVPIEAREYDRPLWTGKEDLAGRVLFLYINQGLGDTIQFYRYAIMAQSRGARVVLSVQRPLVRLLQGADPHVEIIENGAVPAEFDYHAPLMSLPLFFGTSMATIPPAIPYLHPDTERTKSWANRIGTHGFKIGICWDSGASAVGRSIPIAQFSSIAQLPYVRLIALRKHDGAEQSSEALSHLEIEQLGNNFDAGIDAFFDSVSVISLLDLVITADTAMAHLAATLNKPTWVVLKYVPDWRWFLDRDDSPWYPTVRLFRQRAPGDWSSAFDELKSKLISQFSVQS